LHVHFNGAGGNLGAGKYNDGSHAYEQGGYETGPRASNLAPGVEAVLLDGLRELLRDD
jgi:hypothetical protein